MRFHGGVLALGLSGWIAIVRLAGLTTRDVEQEPT